MRNRSISVRNVSKYYKVFNNSNARLKEWLLPFCGKCHEEKWVLNNINLDVYQGEAVGLIGMNGAGKSTLLKIITGTVVPTTGHVSFSGSVSALLELGLGFHADFTGRQNVFMSGQLLGYSAEEIKECMQQIEDFAEIGSAIDEPIRTYSSGMQVRLAFSVATMKRPDVLIVDEALSVGDTYFQQKSFGRIKEFQKEGTTLLLVSHDKAAIQAVCNRAILLDKGRILREGLPEDIMNYYNALLDSKSKNIETALSHTGRGIASGNKKAFVKKIKMVHLDTGVESSEFEVGERIKIEIDVQVGEKLEELNIGMLIKDKYGQDVYGLSAFYEKKLLHDVKKNSLVRYSYFLQLNLGEGQYSITTALHKSNTHIAENYEWKDLAFTFEVENKYKNYFVGCAYLPTEMHVEVGQETKTGEVEWKNIY